MRKKRTPTKPKLFIKLLSQALVVSNTQKIRAELIKQLRKAQESCEKINEQIHKYNDTDHPEFMKWQHKLFGTSMLNLKELNREYQTTDDFMDALEEEALYQGISKPKVMMALLTFADQLEPGEGQTKKVNGDWNPDTLMYCMWRFWVEPRQQKEEAKAKALHEEWVKNNSGKRSSNHRPSIEEMIMDGMLHGTGKPSDFLHNFAAGLFGEHSDFDDDGFGMFDKEERGEKLPDWCLPGTAKTELRQLYRKLCRALHPDVVGTPTPAMSLLWREVQEAYETKNIMRMRNLATTWGLKQDPECQTISCSELIAATRESAWCAKVLARDLRKLRKLPDWKFASFSEKKLNSLSQELSDELEDTIANLKKYLAKAQETFTKQLASARKQMQPKVKTKQEKPSPPTDTLF